MSKCSEKTSNISTNPSTVVCLFNSLGSIFRQHHKTKSTQLPTEKKRVEIATGAGGGGGGGRDWHGMKMTGYLWDSPNMLTL